MAKNIIQRSFLVCFNNAKTTNTQVNDSMILYNSGNSIVTLEPSVTIIKISISSFFMV